MSKEGISSSNPIVSRLQNIHMTLCDSYNTNSEFYTFIKSYNNASGIKSFSTFLNHGLKEIDPKYHPLDLNHEFNIAIKFLGENPCPLEDLLNEKKYRTVMGLLTQNIALLESLDRSYHKYLQQKQSASNQLQSSLSMSSQIIAPMYNQSSQRHSGDLVVDDEYIYSLYCPENTFQKLGPQARGHFLEALLHLRESKSCHLATLIGSQDNVDLAEFLEFMNTKLPFPSHHYHDIVDVAKTTLELRALSEPEFIIDECRLYRENGLNYFGSDSKRVPARPMF